ncbi:chorismate-binding protein [Confluentibacter flavum]|uniref:Isochorismate synthase n=1 Tax=Confluentibacter flavum TaxID=1909700 RepID=A0A2N3HGB0_9FLAO|nr:chorismate-binding protein [Confluentibacter flavum]PKQ44019.1 isochorismate synthase [Confluentibacter flavum]
MVLESFFKRIETQYKNVLPFVVYRKPNSTLVKALFQNDDELYTAETFTETGFVFSPFDDNERTVLIPLDNSEQFEVVFDTVVENKSENKSSKVSADHKLNHTNLINKGIEAVKNNQFIKVVLSRKETVQLSESNPISIFKRLLNTYPLAFVYCWYHPKVGLWLGATPETLIKIEGNRFSIMALAGTQDYMGTTDVVWKDKEINEQQIVTDFIIEHLKPSVEHLSISETETVKAGNLLHLRTMISAHLKPEASNLKQLISDLHPTPAVCGLPKLAAKTFILENEHYNRDFYTGFLGELNFETHIAPRSSKKNIENRAYTVTKKSTQLYVNLRCMQMQGNNAHIYIGGGITETSNAESEWEETVSKSKIIKNILQ